MKNTLWFAAFAFAVLVSLFFISSGKHTPIVPDDVFHSGVTNNAGCTACHTPGMQAPLKKTHPPKFECLICHKMKAMR